MKQTKNPLLLVLAIIGVCAVIYGAWLFYQRAVTQEHSRAAFTGSAPSGIPDIIHATPGALPIQPH